MLKRLKKLFMSCKPLPQGPVQFVFKQNWQKKKHKTNLLHKTGYLNIDSFRCPEGFFFIYLYPSQQFVSPF